MGQSSSSRDGSRFIQSLFFELFTEFVEENLGRFNPRPRVCPIPDRDDLEVDFAFQIAPRPVYLFGVRDSLKARLATIACQAFLLQKLPFRSVVVHEEFEALGPKDRTRITSAADKQFPSLEDFRYHAEEFFEREIA
jgi:hypothetical protein